MRVPPTASRRQQDARPGLPTILLLIATGAVTWAASDAHAHAILMTFIRHEAKVVVGPRNIDITVELTFYEYPSLGERRRMDRDHDEAITTAELSVYMAGLAETLRDSVTLSVDDRPLTVVPLYDPQIDLLEVPKVAPSHHILRLFCFARTPDWLRAGSRIRIEDKLWPDAPRIDVLDAGGKDGVRVTPDDGERPSQTSEGVTGPRVISLSCQAAPAQADAPAGKPLGLHSGQRPPVAPATGSQAEAATVADPVRAGMSGQEKVIAGVGAVLLLTLAAGVAGSVRWYFSHHSRTGDPS